MCAPFFTADVNLQ